MRLAIPILRRVLDYALPPRCPACGTITEADHRFCAPCWARLEFVGPPWCASCQSPFAFDRGAEALCGPCLAAPPRHDGVRAAVAYGDIARDLALRLKYGGRTACAKTMARVMARTLDGDIDVFVPVPLHRWRIWRRGYNQAGLIADALSRQWAGSRRVDPLLRTRSTPALRGMGPDARRRTVRGAFALREGARRDVEDRNVVLVDDIYTSGATSDACVRLLKQAGARSVVVAVWARVLPGESD
ncbi:ComF family protein [Stakelama saccharophila]|uniref:ComF family protein n=1 Tax=Stakelama saccharophila TaxID=3075605 RepID=A0ABZ0B5L4_9SPHN|nr:ComF family protein [Stakelama sp. W311]WNO52664.1 ComF family protein [Stakelama sp. W311]